MCGRLWRTPKISQNFAEEVQFGVQCYGRDKNRTGHHSPLVNYVAAFFWQRKR